MSILFKNFKKLLLGIIFVVSIVAFVILCFNKVMAKDDVNKVTLDKGRDVEKHLSDKIINKKTYTKAMDTLVLKENDINYIFIGDSRTVDLKEVNRDKNKQFIAKVGQSYNYMKTIFPTALSKVNPNKKNVIVSWFGINNIEQGKKYVDYFNSVKLPENTILVCLSITDGRDYRGNKINIKDFNNELKNGAENYFFIDITDKIGRGKAIDCTDGALLHYSKNSDKVLEVINEKLENLVNNIE